MFLDEVLREGSTAGRVSRCLLFALEFLVASRETSGGWHLQEALLKGCWVDLRLWEKAADPGLGALLSHPGLQVELSGLRVSSWLFFFNPHWHLLQSPGHTHELTSLWFSPPPPTAQTSLLSIPNHFLLNYSHQLVSHRFQQWETKSISTSNQILLQSLPSAIPLTPSNSPTFPSSVVTLAQLHRILRPLWGLRTGHVCK